MKVALVFAGIGAAKSAFQPYRSRHFTRALAAEGFESVLVDLDIGGTSRFAAMSHDAPEIRYYRNQVDRLPLILQQERPSVVLTFGPTIDLAPVWRAGAKAAAPLIHFVASEGGVPERFASPGLGFVGTRPRQLPALWNAQLASAKVAGLLGSNRADLGRQLRRRFFPRVRLSAVAPPPLPTPAETASAADAHAAARPVFGFFDADATASAVRFLFRALDLTGPAGSLDLRVAPAAAAGYVPERVSQARFVDDDEAAFLGAIDVLLVPEASDRTVPVIAAALAARRIVVVPDAGTASELVDYGRHGVLFHAGSAYHLAMAINVLKQSWSNRPISFEGVDSVLARACPEAVAQVFARTFRRLVR